jgi:thiamine pyrophosphokinase
MRFDKSKIILIEDQETNDFEKNLIFAKESGYQNIAILGFHGGELEHSLNNWSVFMRYSKGMNLCIYDEYRYGIPIRESIRFNADENEIISIIPQTRTRIITKNLKWALNNEILEFGIREGAGNVAIEQDIQIELIEGEYLLFINSRLPHAPIFNKMQKNDLKQYNVIV